MGTRAIYGYKDGDTYKLGYNSQDGYPSGLGRLLINHYNTWDLVKRLVHEVKEIPDFEVTIEDMLKRQQGRDYDDCEVIECTSLEKLLEEYGDVEYLYLFDGVWRVCYSDLSHSRVVTNRVVYLDDNPLSEDDLQDLEETLEQVAFNWQSLSGALVARDFDKIAETQKVINKLLEVWL